MKNTNKQTYLLMVLLVAVAVILSACNSGTGNQANTNIDVSANDADNAGADNSNTANAGTAGTSATATADNSLSMDKLYNYGMVKNFEYVTKTGTATVNTKYSMKADTVDGKAAWLQTTEMTAEGANIVTKTWLDKTTYSCLKITSSVVVMGNTMDQSVECPTTGVNAKSTSTETPQLTYVGMESVTVPAGTFSAKKYSLQGITYWYDSSVPIPLKVEFSGGSMELVSYN